MSAIAVRARLWISGQTRTSAAALAAGVASLVVGVGGSIVLLVVKGLGSYERIDRTIQSRNQRTLLVVGIVLGLAAVVAGWGWYRRMPTKAAREACVAGAVLGVQALIFALVYLWFRSGDTTIFVRNFFRFEVLDGFGGQFLRGARNTILLAAFGEGIGIVLGLVLSFLVLSKRAVVRAPARAYINFMRGTPLLFQLSFFFFGFVLGLRLEISPYQAAILILGLNAGAYTAEIFRAGIQSIERGQMEAARSLGMSYPQAMRHVLLPQAIRRVIPPLTNEFVILIKDTSLISFLGLTFAEREILAVGRDVYSETFNASPYLAVAAAYLAVTLPMIRLVTWVERRLRSGLVGIGA
jgi:His/Glu/Gln/Arg/opine family amino acid ABC transporter permease subunit